MVICGAICSNLRCLDRSCRYMILEHFSFGLKIDRMKVSVNRVPGSELVSSSNVSPAHVAECSPTPPVSINMNQNISLPLHLVFLSLTTLSVVLNVRIISPHSNVTTDTVLRLYVYHTCASRQNTPSITATK